MLLGKNEKALSGAIIELAFMIQRGDLTVDLEGCKTAELIGNKFVFDPYQKILDFGVKKTNEAYVEKELNWYMSMSRSIHPMMEGVKIWKEVADRDGIVNSNYGWCIFSKENGEQFDNCLSRMRQNPYTKRGVMIYTRPSMWKDCEENGRSDFICTDGVQLSVKHNKLIYIVKQRSCDLLFGLFNDLAWHQYVYTKFFMALHQTYSWLEKGTIMYFPFNLHVYERHFKKVLDMEQVIRDCYREFEQ